MTSNTPASYSNTAVWTDGGPIYSCRCGHLHLGDGAYVIWRQHQCLHNAPLRPIVTTDGRTLEVLCPDCGGKWLVGKAIRSEDAAEEK